MGASYPASWTVAAVGVCCCALGPEQRPLSEPSRPGQEEPLGASLLTEKIPVWELNGALAEMGPETGQGQP